MSKMVGYIVKTIKRARAISLEAGQAKYRAYFVNTLNYAEEKIDLDVILGTDGFADCIVTV